MTQRGRALPGYSIIGALVMLVSQAEMLLKVEPFWSWHTPVAWTGYILFVDGLVWKRRGDSWLARARAELAFLALVSTPLWLIFEFFNLFIENWYYVNLPEQAALRYLGYEWSFATIWPAIFETGELIATFRSSSARPDGAASTRQRPSIGLNWLSIVAGAAMLVWPLAWPSPFLAAPVWLGFIFLLDPINARLGGESLAADWRRGRTDRLVNLCGAGFLCGLLWEFWNYWARTKWVYAVPILPNLRLFEMPLPGYVGFPAFALECFTMYVTTRWLLWRGPCRPISL